MWTLTAVAERVLEMAEVIRKNACVSVYTMCRCTRVASTRDLPMKTVDYWKQFRKTKERSHSVTTEVQICFK